MGNKLGDFNTLNFFHHGFVLVFYFRPINLFGTCTQHINRTVL